MAGPVPQDGKWLERQAVTARTQQYYSKVLDRLLPLLNAQQVSFLDAPRVDEIITAVLQEMYFEGLDGGEGTRVLAAWAHEFPEYGRHGTLSLPHASRAARAFKRLAPARSRGPIPLSLAVATSMAAFHRKQFRQGVGMLLMFVCYLRPSELLTLLGRHVMRPVTQLLGAGAGAVPSLLVRPFEGEGSRPTKVGEFDDSVPLDAPYLQELNVVLLRLQGQTDPNRPLFPFSYVEFKECFEQCLLDASLADLNLTLYSFRHGGPSHDRALGFRNLEAIAKRGRWMTMASVRRYEKAARIQYVLNQTPAVGQRYAAACMEVIGQVLLGNRAPLPPPSVASQSSSLGAGGSTRR